MHVVVELSPNEAIDGVKNLRNLTEDFLTNWEFTTNITLSATELHKIESSKETEVKNF